MTSNQVERESPWFTVAEAARYARVGEDIVTRWIREGRLEPSVTRDKKNLKGRGAAGYVLHRDDIDKCLRSLKANVAGEALAESMPTPEPPKMRPRPSGRPNVETLSERLKKAGL